MTMRLTRAIFLFVFGFAGAVSAGQFVVIEASGVDLSPGQVVDGGQPLTLPAGAKVKLISEAGQLTAIEGPFSGPPDVSGGKANGDAGLVSSLAQLVGGKPAQSAALGVMRAGVSDLPPGPWVVDLRRSGSHCVQKGESPVLWRSDSDKTGTLSLKALPKGARAKVRFKAGVAEGEWPADVTISDWGQYLARMTGRATASKVVLRLIPSDLPTDAHRAAWMADMGCTAQAKQLLSAMR
jgi:hypothetical protein